MTDAAPGKSNGEAAGDDQQIDAGSYELLRNRLLEQAKTLGTKADGLNQRRIEVFGGTEMAVAGQVRVRTEN